MSTVKEMWNYLEEIHSENNNFNRAFDVIQEMFRSRKGSKILSQHYADFNRIYEEMKVLFLISQDVKKMQKQWDQLAVLTLVRLPSEYTHARP